MFSGIGAHSLELKLTTLHHLSAEAENERRYVQYPHMALCHASGQFYSPFTA